VEERVFTAFLAVVFFAVFLATAFFAMAYFAMALRAVVFDLAARVILRAAGLRVVFALAAMGFPKCNYQ